MCQKKATLSIREEPFGLLSKNSLNGKSRFLPGIFMSYRQNQTHYNKYTPGDKATLFRCNPSVTGRKPQRIQVRREYQEVPWPGGAVPPRRDWNTRRRFLRGRGGGQGLPPLISESQGFLRISAHPDRCFRRVPPEPPGQQQSLPPPVTEWVRQVLSPP